MIRETSIEVYRAVLACGYVGRLHKKIYQVIYEHGPITQIEVRKWYLPEHQHQSITPRFSELEEMGVITVVGERICRVSGKTCIIYVTTNNLPQKREKRETSKEKIKRLEKENQKLKIENAKLKLKLRIYEAVKTPRNYNEAMQEEIPF